MAVIGGILGAVNGQSTVRNWSINYTAALAGFSGSNMLGGMGYLAGNKDWSGSFSAYGWIPGLVPGSSFTFTGSIDGTKGVTGTAIVDQVVLVVDIEGGRVIEYSVTFSANGALTRGAAVAVDATDPTARSSIGSKVELAVPAAEPSWVELADVRTITLTFSATNPSYVDSSGGGQTKRVSGPFDAGLAISVYSDEDLTPLPEPNTVMLVRVYVGDTEYWELSACRFADITNVVVDRETGAVVGGTLNAKFSYYYEIAGEFTAGAIIDPDEATYWPPA